MLIRFTVKGFYLLVIGLVVALATALIAYAVLTPFWSEYTVGVAYLPFWILTFGIILILGDGWWRLRDPNATLFFMLMSLRSWGVVTILLGLYLIGRALVTGSVNATFLAAGGYTVSVSALYGVLYYWKKQRTIKKSSSTP